MLESDSPVAEDCLQHKFLSILELAVLTDTVPAKDARRRGQEEFESHLKDSS